MGRRRPRAHRERRRPRHGRPGDPDDFRRRLARLPRRCPADRICLASGAGQKATIELAGGRAPVAGAVHSILPGANAADFTGQVRVDLPGAAAKGPIGLFGTVRILVGERSGVAVVADAAVLRDDVSGVSRVCLVVNGKAHWIDVSAGARDRAGPRSSRRRSPTGRRSSCRGSSACRRARASPSSRNELLRRLPERPQALFLLLLVLCAAGVWTATTLPSAIFPTVTFPRVKVIAEGAEEPAAQMIPAVTRPLEEAILRVPGIERVISTTTRGSVEIERRVLLGHRHAARAAARPGRDRAVAPGSSRRPAHRRRVDEHGRLPDPRLRAHLGHAVAGGPAGARRLPVAARAHPDPRRLAGAGPGRAPCGNSRCGSTRRSSPRAGSPRPTSWTRSGRTTS